MTAFLIILAALFFGFILIELANAPSKKNPTPRGAGKSVKRIGSVFDLIFPRLD